MKYFEIKENETVYDGFLKILKLKVKHEKHDGTYQTIDREIMHRGDAVGLVVHNVDNDTVVMAQEFRTPIGYNYQFSDNKDEITDNPWSIAVPAGILEDKEGKSRFEVAKMELEEEIGYRVDDENLKEIAIMYVSPGGTTERIFLFYAKVTNKDKVSDGGGLEEEKEDIKAVEYRLDFIEHLIDRKLIVDAKTLIGLQWVLRKKDKGEL